MATNRVKSSEIIVLDDDDDDTKHAAAANVVRRTSKPEEKKSAFVVPIVRVQQQQQRSTPIASSDSLATTTSSHTTDERDIGQKKKPQQPKQPRDASCDGEVLSEAKKRTIAEFQTLLENSKQMFNGLRLVTKAASTHTHYVYCDDSLLDARTIELKMKRELPQYGHKTRQWQAYFDRTFDIYTNLWKFQQQHRQLLEKRCDLKRWHIGDIASKIGQLYYHY